MIDLDGYYKRLGKEIVLVLLMLILSPLIIITSFLSTDFRERFSEYAKERVRECTKLQQEGEAITRELRKAKDNR